MASKFFKAFNFFKGKVSPTITSVNPAVGKSKIKKAIDDVRLTALKTKGQMKKQSQDFNRDIQKVKSKLGQSMQKLKGEPVTESGVSKGKDLIKKAKGGRVGLKAGTNPFKKKSNVDKIKETFGPKKRVNAKKGFPDLSGDGKTTFKDILIGRGVIKKKNGKNKKKVI